MNSLIQKLVVHKDGKASDVMPQHVALVNEDGTPFSGSASAATVSAAGTVKKASATDAVSAANAAQAASSTVTKAEFDAVVALCNELKTKFNDHLTKAKSAGQMA